MIEAIPNQEAVRTRLLSNIQINNNGCWIWKGAVMKRGYATTTIGSKRNGTYRKVYVHRLLYELVVGEIPVGKELDHLCRVRNCANPDHLEPVTRSENARRGIGPTLAALRNINKTHCPHGHPYDERNTYLRKGGGRACRTCARERGRVKHNYQQRRVFP